MNRAFAPGMRRCPMANPAIVANTTAGSRGVLRSGTPLGTCTWLDSAAHEGVDPPRVDIGHADSYPNLEHLLSIVERGASIEFDFLGMSFTPQERHGESRIILLLCELLARGHVERVLLSQDVCHDSQLTRYEGNGYTYLTRTFLPSLREAGVSAAEIDTMTIANPRCLLTID